jgi:hypothetical protein
VKENFNMLLYGIEDMGNYEVVDGKIVKKISESVAS